MLIAVLLAVPFTVAPATSQAAAGNPRNPGGSLAAGAPLSPAEASSILKGAELRTEWGKARNPFRFEIKDTPADTPERLEQMQILGFSKMPDATGALRTYAFVAKTVEGFPSPGNQPEPAVTKDLHILEALPEKIAEDTRPTEEQTEASLISLGNEPLWFLGLIQTNQHVLAVFLPDHAPYPIQEENLRCFEVQDSLKDLHIRVTPAGKKISTEAHLPRLLRSSSKHKPLRSDGTPATLHPISEPAATPQTRGTNAVSEAAKP